MKLYLSHSTNFDFQAQLYQPLKKSNLNTHQIFFPHDPENDGTHSKSIIDSSDFMLAEVSYTSTGQGIEMGWADSANIPIVCFYKEGSEISGSISYVASHVIVYTSLKDMIAKLTDYLQN